MPVNDQCKHLLAAVVARAAMDMDDKRLRGKAIKWIESPCDGEMSYKWCCAQLEIDEVSNRIMCPQAEQECLQTSGNSLDD